MGASSGADSFKILFGMSSGPSALEILREDRYLRTSVSETRYSCGTDTGVAPGRIRRGGKVISKAYKIVIDHVC